MRISPVVRTSVLNFLYMILFSHPTAKATPSQTLIPSVQNSKEVLLLDPSTQRARSSLGTLLDVLLMDFDKFCTLIFFYDDSTEYSDIFQDILTGPFLKQFHRVTSEEQFNMAFSQQFGCGAFLFFFRTKNSTFQEFCDKDERFWDYSKRYILITDDGMDSIERFFLSKKGRKTEHLFGLIKVITFEWKPSILYRKSKNDTVTPFGIDVEVTRALAATFNFSLLFKEPPPGEFWGAKLENGTWIGLVGELVKGNGHIGVANLFLTYQRLGAIDYSTPYDAEVSCFLLRKPPPPPEWVSITFPFQMSTWIAIVVIYCLSASIFRLLLYFNRKYEATDFQSTSHVFTYMFGSMMKVGVEHTPVRNSSRIFFGLFTCYALIITTAYSSNLTAYLTVTREPASIETIQQLHGTGLEISSIGPFFQGELASAVDPYLKGLAERFVSYNSFLEWWPKLLDGQTVYLHNRQYLEYEVAVHPGKDRIAPVKIMKECFSPYNIAMALEKHTPFKRVFDNAIMKMTEAGLMQLTQAHSMESEENIDSENSVVAIGLSHLKGVFFLLMFGLAFATIAFIVEYNVI